MSNVHRAPNVDGLFIWPFPEHVHDHVAFLFFFLSLLRRFQLVLRCATLPSGIPGCIPSASSNEPRKYANKRSQSVLMTQPVRRCRPVNNHINFTIDAYSSRQLFLADTLNPILWRVSAELAETAKLCNSLQLICFYDTNDGTRLFKLLTLFNLLSIKFPSPSFLSITTLIGFLK